MQDLVQLALIGLGQGSLYALIALGFVLIYKCSGILNLAQGEFVLLGGYLGYAFSSQFNLPWAVSIVLVLVVMALVSMVLERVALRPLIGQPLLPQILVTLGISSFIQGAILVVWGGTLQKPQPIFPSGGLEYGGILLSYENLFSIVLTGLLLAVFVVFFKYARLGLRMRAVADDPVAAQTVGTRLASIYQTSWVIAAVVAALGGTVLASIGGVHIGLASLGLKSVVVVLLGGMESVAGVVIAGPIVGLIEVLAIQYVDPYVGGGIKDVVSFAILIPILLIRPYGFFGWKRIDRV